MKREYVCVGFVPIVCFIAFKLAGMFDHSWWWIIPMCFIGYFRDKK